MPQLPSSDYLQQYAAALICDWHVCAFVHLPAHTGRRANWHAHRQACNLHTQTGVQLGLRTRTGVQFGTHAGRRATWPAHTNRRATWLAHTDRRATWPAHTDRRAAWHASVSTSACMYTYIMEPIDHFARTMIAWRHGCCMICLSTYV